MDAPGLALSTACVESEPHEAAVKLLLNVCRYGRRPANVCGWCCVENIMMTFRFRHCIWFIKFRYNNAVVE